MGLWRLVLEGCVGAPPVWWVCTWCKHKAGDGNHLTLEELMFWLAHSTQKGTHTARRRRRRARQGPCLVLGHAAAPGVLSCGWWGWWSASSSSCFFFSSKEQASARVWEASPKPSCCFPHAHMPPQAQAGVHRLLASSRGGRTRQGQWADWTRV